MEVVHVTHEAVEKIGGIGAVIAGLVTADAYAENVSRTVLLGPLLDTDNPIEKRLGEGGTVLYSSLDAVAEPQLAQKFRAIERTYDVGIIYGRRKVIEPCNARQVEVEVLLVDVFHCNPDRLSLFKGELFRKFAVPSHEFEKVWEYEQYVRLAEPGFEALKAIGCDGDEKQLVLLAHEYMGMPLALKANLDGAPNIRTVFYAHEVASVRPVVEESPGHDTMFYNVLERAGDSDRTCEDIFPQVFGNFKHPLVKAARYCDHVFAVGDYIESELRFLDPHFRTMKFDLVYNGIPAERIEIDDKRAGKGRLRQYAENLLGVRPTWIFTRVARPVLSKGVWRDMGLCHHLERLLAKRGETAVYFMLGTLAGQRRPRDVLHMERAYGWPVTHEEGYPDLCGGEEVVGYNFDDFNRHHEAIRAVFVNQWDFNRRVCGMRMPEDMTFADLRRGSDLEFGLSVYEPFGISQFEALTFGALCVVSNVCGCMGFARRSAAAAGLSFDENIIEADFLDLPACGGIDELVGMSMSQREKVESREAKRLAKMVDKLLPRSDKVMLARIESGYELARNMSWEHVVRDYFLPSLGRTIS